MSALRRVCSYCKRLIVGLNEPGGPSGDMTEHDSHGICSECLVPLMKQIEESKKNNRKLEGQAGPWNQDSTTRLRNFDIRKVYDFKRTFATSPLTSIKTIDGWRLSMRKHCPPRPEIPMMYSVAAERLSDHARRQMINACTASHTNDWIQALAGVKTRKEEAQAGPWSRDTKKQYILIQDGQERHEHGCQCGFCNSQGKSYSVSLYHYDPSIPDEETDEYLSSREVVDRGWGPTEEAAEQDALAYIRELGGVHRKLNGQAGPWNKDTLKKRTAGPFFVYLWEPGTREPSIAAPPEEQLDNLWDACCWVEKHAPSPTDFFSIYSGFGRKILSGIAADVFAHYYRFRDGMSRIASDEPVKTTIFQGLLIGIENPSGSTRSGQSRSGHKWSIKMKGLSYGFICGSEGADEDSVDVYLRDDPDENAEYAYVIRQNNPKTGAFDEEKVMVGWNSVVDAVKAYVGQFDKKGFYGGCTPVKMSNLHDKLATMRRKRKAVRISTGSVDDLNEKRYFHHRYPERNTDLHSKHTPSGDCVCNPSVHSVKRRELTRGGKEIVDVTYRHNFLTQPTTLPDINYTEGVIEIEGDGGARMTDVDRVLSHNHRMRFVRTGE